MRVALAALALMIGALPAEAVTFRRLPLPEPGKIALLIEGAIEPGDAQRLRDIGPHIPAGQRIAMVVLNSPGGAVIDGRDMARIIRAHNVPVVVPAEAVCASACFLLFAAGRERIAEPGARIGVHSASVSGGRESMDTLGVTTLMAREAAGYGVPAAITGRMVTTQPGQMAWLTPDELTLMRARVAAGVAPGGVGAPGSSAEGGPSDWTRGFQFGAANHDAPCDPPAGVARADDWKLGCRSGQTAQATAAPAVGDGAGGSDWSVGFARGRAGQGCDAPPPAIANAEDWKRGCASGKRS